MSIRLYRFELNLFCLIQGKRAHVGSLAKTIRTMRELGISSNEIEAGLSSLVSNEHAVADYGVSGTFIYSKSL